MKLYPRSGGRQNPAPDRAGPTVVIGAGPYGLSVAAHLWRTGARPVVLGRPMEFWDGMPPRMFLKSSWSASSLSDPDGEHTLDRYVVECGAPRAEPISLPFFREYCRWFRARAVPDVDAGEVRTLGERGAGFRLELT